MATKRTNKSLYRRVEVSGLETQTADFYLSIEKATPATGQDMYILVNRQTKVIEMRGFALWLMVCAMQTQQQALNKARTGEINGFSTAPSETPRATVVTPTLPPAG